MSFLDLVYAAVLHPVQWCDAEVTTEIGDGGTDIHIDEGSQLRLDCKLRYVTEIPTFVFWWVLSLAFSGNWVYTENSDQNSDQIMMEGHFKGI